MQVDGSCLCGNLAFEAQADSNFVFVCHCEDCQVQSGTSFRTVARIDSESFQLTRGELKCFVKTAESGRTRSLAFCPECGSSIYGGPGPGETGFMSLRVGTLRQRDQLVPRAQLWTRSAQPWLAQLHALPSVDTQPDLERSATADEESQT